MRKVSKSDIDQFQKIIFEHYMNNGRHQLPWRKTKNPYRILVSEVMLQQTQVERVVPYYREWLKHFPTAKELAAASLGDVLRVWQGLGYNRRGKMLHAAGKQLAAMKAFPKTAAELETLPGIGPYTARAVMAFAYNKDEVFIETNIRTTILHHFFKDKNSTIYSTVSDKDIFKILEEVLPRGKSGEWHAALMDYGSSLKRSGVRLNARAKGYKKQAAFRGSKREARGAILKALTKGARSGAFLVGILGDDRVAQAKSQLASLTKEGLIELSGEKFHLPR